MRVLGIDLSTTSTGFVVLEVPDEMKAERPGLLHTSLCKPKEKGHERQSKIMSDMIDVLNAHRPDRVILENYGLSFGRTSSIVPLVEIGGLVRYMLTQYEYDYATTTPSEHKKFVTGSGAGSGKAVKQKIMKAVADRWGYETKSNDLADAYGLAVMGLAAAGRITGLTSLEREILGNLRSPACN